MKNSGKYKIRGWANIKGLTLGSDKKVQIITVHKSKNQGYQNKERLKCSGCVQDLREVRQQKTDHIDGWNRWPCSTTGNISYVYVSTEQAQPHDWLYSLIVSVFQIEGKKMAVQKNNKKKLHTHTPPPPVCMRSNCQTALQTKGVRHKPRSALCPWGREQAFL